MQSQIIFQEREVFKRLFANIFENVLVVAWDGQILYGNPQAIKFYGYTEEAFLKLNILDIRASETIDQLKNQLDTALSEGIEFETVHVKKYGEHVPVKVRSIYAENSRFQYVVSVVTDLTEVRKLKERAEMFDVSLDISDEAIIVYDPDFKVTEWNKAAESRLGYSREDIIGKEARTMVPEDKLEETKILRALLRRGNIIDRIETKRVHKNGDLLELSVAYSPIFDSMHNIMGYIGVYSDLTTAKKLKREMEDYKNRAVLALDGAHFCMWEVDLNQDPLLVLNNMESLLGYETGEMGNDYKKWIKRLHKDDVEGFMNHIKTLKNDLIYELRILDKFEGYRWIRCKGKVYKTNENDQPIQVVGTCEDITDWKRAELELKNKNIELEYLMTESQKATEAKNQFLANMSHEIRNPLNGIIASIQLLKTQSVEESERVKLYEMLESSSLMLKGIVSEVLDLSKVSQNKVEVRHERFSLKMLMQEIFTIVQLEANSKGLDVSFYFDPKIEFELLGDAQKIKQVMINLTSNAVKFSDEGYVSIKAKLDADASGKARIGFEVKDTGIGVKENELELIFEPFLQGDSSDEKRYNGVGLGLAIAREYVRAMGGEITCTSQPGKGSRFGFILELEKADSIKVDDVTVPKTAKIENKKFNILCIDDSIVNQNVIRLALKSDGYEYFKAYNAEDAIEVLKSSSVHLILMDIQLPNTNGYRLTETIKQNPNWADIPIIAMTAYARSEDRDKCLRHGMNEYISKPIDLDLLKLKIQYFR